MAFCSKDEDNYVKLIVLLTGISPRAARTFFDNEFDPLSLDSLLKRKYGRLLQLKQNQKITEKQWELLFPKSPGKCTYQNDIRFNLCSYSNLKVLCIHATD